MMKTQLMILMFVVSVLLSSCVVAPSPYVPKPEAQVEPLAKKYYVVKPGDTLFSIAQRYNGINDKDIANWNNISHPDELRSGQKLVLSPPNQPKVGKRLIPPQNPAGTSGCGKQVAVINPTPFFHPCPPSTHQCTGVHYVIANTSITTKTVTIQYRQLGQINVLNQNIQIPANSMIKSRAYEVADTVDKQNIVITCIN